MKVFLWGTGYVANKIVDECESLSNYEILGFIDNDVSKHNTTFRGYKVYSISVLEENNYDKIVILTYSFEIIKKQILATYPTVANRIENWLFFYRSDILTKYENSKDKEIQSILEHIQRNDLNVFNYEFSKKYAEATIEVFYDESCLMHYVMHKGKPLYFPKEYNAKKVADYYRSLLVEQDEASPHKYCDDSVKVNPNDVILDVGVAEGNFTLEYIDIISHAYLIEGDGKWIEALNKTFSFYSNKVTIINAFVSSTDDNNYRCLDTLLGNTKIDFIKMDIEGWEENALEGAKALMSDSSKMNAAICCYHSENDEKILTSQMEEFGFMVHPSEGYMWFPFAYKQKYVSTKLVRGVLRCMK